MSPPKPFIGRTLRRLRKEQNLSQQALASKLGISASYLNLIEHDQRAVTASLLLKLARLFQVDLTTLAGGSTRETEAALREAFADPLLASDPVSTDEVAALVDAAPNAARAILSLHRAWLVARDDSSGITLPSGRRILLPSEEARDAFHARANHFPALEAVADRLRQVLPAPHGQIEAAIHARLREQHGVQVQISQSTETQRRYVPDTRQLHLSQSLPRESRKFHMALMLLLLEARDAVDAEVASLTPSTPEAAALLLAGLLNYTAAAVLMPYDAYLNAARTLRYDVDILAAQFGVSFEQACHRLATLNRTDSRGVPFFFLRTDAAGNVTKRFSAAGFPFARHGGSCPRFVPHQAFSAPGQVRVQYARLPDGATFFCFAKAFIRPGGPWPEPPLLYAVAMGCDATHADSLVYADSLALPAGCIDIGLSCRLCDRPNCHNRAFAPVAHKLNLNPDVRGKSAYAF